LHECTFADDLHCGSDHRRKRPHKLPDQIVKERTQASQDPGKSGNYTPANGRIKALARFVLRAAGRPNPPPRRRPIEGSNRAGQTASAAPLRTPY
jgi:hypothetical protein